VPDFMVAVSTVKIYSVWPECEAWRALPGAATPRLTVTGAGNSVVAAPPKLR
jgi:hypothetical protein